MNLAQYHELILKPSILRAIAKGQLDSAIVDPDCFDIIFGDPDLLNAARNRLKEIDPKLDK